MQIQFFLVLKVKVFSFTMTCPLVIRGAGYNSVNFAGFAMFDVTVFLCCAFFPSAVNLFVCTSARAFLVI